MDDPLSSFPLFLQVYVPAETFFPVSLVLLLLFFLSTTLLSAVERASRSLSDKDISFIENNYKQKILAGRILQARRLYAAFALGKYICLISMGLLCYSLLKQYNPDGIFLNPALALCFNLVLFFFSFICSRALVARSPLNTVRRFSMFILITDYLFLPFTIFYQFISALFDRKTENRQDTLSMDELGHALDLSKHAETNSEEHKLLKGIITFGHMDITRIMKPKMDIVAFDFHTPYPDLLKSILESGYSRIPVFNENIDKIVGVLYIKDLLAHLDEQPDFQWQSLLRPCFFIPENKKPDDLLQEFRHKKTHLAIVVDEFGQTTGLVTLEDIIEEIVGEINDEFDEEEITYSRLDDSNYVFEGKTSMNDFLRIVGRSEESIRDLKSDADTLSGFIIERSGRFPKKNEKVNWENFTFNIESSDSRRIKRVKVTIRKKTIPA